MDLMAFLYSVGRMGGRWGFYTILNYNSKNIHINCMISLFIIQNIVI